MAETYMWKVVQWFLLVLGVLCIAYCGEVSLKGKLGQARGARELQHQLSSTQSLANGDVLGRLEIPRLSLSTVVFEGADPSVLEVGAGHLPGSALPGSPGNTVLAAHRDTFFRPLRGIRIGDRITVHETRRDHVYVVNSARVVQPDDVGVMKPTAEPSLTLITCYPFRFIGPAPERFVVRAVLVR